VKLQIELDGNTYDVDVEIIQNDVAPVTGEVLPSPPDVNPESGPNVFTRRKKRQLRLRSDDHECRSPMCGTIVRVNVKAGQVVEADDVVLVLEAMKMETNIKAQSTCRVKSVKVKPGDGVVTDQVMVEFE
jgi:methylmalonyl-CoA carboxyltransferase small subunit